MKTTFKVIHGTSMSNVEKGVNDFIDKLEREYDIVEVTVRTSFNAKGNEYAEVTASYGFNEPTPECPHCGFSVG